MSELTLKEAALAWAQGKRVEAMGPSNEWGLIQLPGSKDGWWRPSVFSGDNGSVFKFRLSPEPPAKRYRPWTPEEVPVGAVIRSKKHAWRSLILGVTSSGYIQIHDGGFASDFTIDNHEYSTDHGKTWLPCGVEVEA